MVVIGGDGGDAGDGDGGDGDGGRGAGWVVVAMAAAAGGVGAAAAATEETTVAGSNTRFMPSLVVVQCSEDVLGLDPRSLIHEYLCSFTAVNPLYKMVLHNFWPPKAGSGSLLPYFIHLAR